MTHHYQINSLPVKDDCCQARVWGPAGAPGWGGQCTSKPTTGSEFCAKHNNTTIAKRYTKGLGGSCPECSRAASRPIVHQHVWEHLGRYIPGQVTLGPKWKATNQVSEQTVPDNTSLQDNNLSQTPPAENTGLVSEPDNEKSVLDQYAYQKTAFTRTTTTSAPVLWNHSDGIALPAPSVPTNTDKWTSSEVSQWLETLPDLKQYATSFAENEIDGEALLELTDQDLKGDLGIAPLGHRKQLLRLIKKLGGKSEEAVPLALPASEKVTPAFTASVTAAAVAKAAAADANEVAKAAANAVTLASAISSAISASRSAADAAALATRDYSLSSYIRGAKLTKVFKNLQEIPYIMGDWSEEEIKLWEGLRNSGLFRPLCFHDSITDWRTGGKIDETKRRENRKRALMEMGRTHGYTGLVPMKEITMRISSLLW